MTDTTEKLAAAELMTYEDTKPYTFYDTITVKKAALDDEHDIKHFLVGMPNHDEGEYFSREEMLALGNSETKSAGGIHVMTRNKRNTTFGPNTE